MSGGGCYSQGGNKAITLLLLGDGDGFVVFQSCCSAGTVRGYASSPQRLHVDIHSFTTEGLETLLM